MPTNTELWSRYKKFLCECPSLGLTIDISRMDFPHDYFTSMTGGMNAAFDAMDKIDHGAKANVDEDVEQGGRMVGHYWLRDARRAPEPQIQHAIESTIAAVKQFALDVHAGKIAAQDGKPFEHVLVIGIGGSALGPQFVADALSSPADKMRMAFSDNTDPDGMDKVLVGLPLQRTLTIVISKSGETKETRNGMLVAAAAYKAAGLDFARHAVAITGAESRLDKIAVSEGWIKRFPMWDWVGGRTSELSAVGLLPAVLQGLDIDAMLHGARNMDEISRLYEMTKNPAALLALMWYHANKKAKDMVILPYKDRLLLFSRYLQQLIMESLGKEQDRTAKIVHAGISVYGNKGSTDQHAYVQQLRDGINNFYVTFIEVLKDRSTLQPNGPASGLMVKSEDNVPHPDVTSGDFLHGFFQGTRKALYENGRESLTITVEEVSPRAIGVLIALFERAVGLYAELININAYHQPGVQAGKKAASAVLYLQLKILAHLRTGHRGTAEQIALTIGAGDDVETVHHILCHLAANPDHKVAASAAASAVETVYAAGK